MSTYDPSSIAKLVGQLGGNQQQATQMMSALSAQGQEVDPSNEDHADMLQKIGIDPSHLANGGYQQHLDSQS